jgi:hypothetical protein
MIQREDLLLGLKSIGDTCPTGHPINNNFTLLLHWRIQSANEDVFFHGSCAFWNLLAELGKGLVSREKYLGGNTGNASLPFTP